MSNLMHRQTIFIVDDDAGIRDSLSLLLSLRGYATAVFACAEDFLGALASHWRGVVIADIRMPGLSGLELQGLLARHPARLPVIIITGHGDIAAARQAFKAEAVDFLEKPFDDEQLLGSIERALQGVAAVPDLALGTGLVPTTLSQREREVMALVVAGASNGAIGEKLSISHRTGDGSPKARALVKQEFGRSRSPQVSRDGQAGRAQLGGIVAHRARIRAIQLRRRFCGSARTVEPCVHPRKRPGQ